MAALVPRCANGLNPVRRGPCASIVDPSTGHASIDPTGQYDCCRPIRSANSSTGERLARPLLDGSAVSPCTCASPPSRTLRIRLPAGTATNTTAISAANRRFDSLKTFCEEEIGRPLAPPTLVLPLALVLLALQAAAYNRLQSLLQATRGGTALPLAVELLPTVQLGVFMWAVYSYMPVIAKLDREPALRRCAATAAGQHGLHLWLASCAVALTGAFGGALLYRQEALPSRAAYRAALAASVGVLFAM